MSGILEAQEDIIISGVLLLLFLLHPPLLLLLLPKLLDQQTRQNVGCCSLRTRPSDRLSPVRKSLFKQVEAALALGDGEGNEQQLCKLDPRNVPMELAHVPPRRCCDDNTDGHQVGQHRHAASARLSRPCLHHRHTLCQGLPLPPSSPESQGRLNLDREKDLVDELFRQLRRLGKRLCIIVRNDVEVMAPDEPVVLPSSGKIKLHENVVCWNSNVFGSEETSGKSQVEKGRGQVADGVLMEFFPHSSSTILTQRCLVKVKPVL